MEKELRQGFGKYCRCIYTIFLVCVRNAHKIGIFIILLTLSCNLDKINSFTLSNNGINVKMVQNMEQVYRNYKNEVKIRKDSEANLRSINALILRNCTMAVESSTQNQNIRSTELDKLQNQQKIFDARERELSQQTDQSLQDFLQVLQKTSHSKIK